MSNPNNPLMLAALKYAASGKPVFPCGGDKKPLVKTGFKAATMDPKQIQAWWSEFPGASIGAPTGPEMGKAGAWVLDVDVPKAPGEPDGRETLATFEAQHGPLPSTVEQRTRNGGRQLFFRWPESRVIRNSAKKIGLGLDVCGAGGYVILPPSHVEPDPYPRDTFGADGEYAWGSNGAVLAAAPEWLLDLVAPLPKPEASKPPTAPPVKSAGTTPYGRQALENEAATVAGTAQGGRNHALNAAAFVVGQLVAGGELDRGEAEAALQAAAGQCGLSEGEARQAIASGMKAGEQKPRTAPEPIPRKRRGRQAAPGEGKAERQKLAHLDMAHSCIADFGPGNLIFALGDYWRWDASGVWRRTDPLLIKQAIHRLFPAEIKSAHTVASVADLARTAAFRGDAEFDQPTPRSINCLSGMLTWTGEAWELRPHRKEDYATSQIPVAYGPDAVAPRFEQFLGEVFADDEDAEEKAILVCEVLGYSLLTSCEFEKFVLLIGAGANGKSVLMNLMALLAGRGNVCAVQPSQFENKFQRAHMHGKLVNIVSELAEGAEIADAQLKAIASGEMITAEHKLKPPFGFRPYSTCWFGTNHLPHTRDFSQALFRRAIVVTFNRVFSEQEQDNRLSEKLAAELPGVFNLALEGMAGVFERGTFTAPISSDRARQEWRVQADQVAQFAEDRCHFGPGLAITSKEIFERYQEWAVEAGISRKLNRKNFSDRMSRLGATLHRGAGGTRAMLGVGMQ